MSESVGELNTFQLFALFGISQPNTNGFVHGGQKIRITGKYLTHDKTDQNPNARIFELTSKKFQSPLLLMEMDKNILHFVALDRSFLVGNGGWSFLLNKVRP